MTRTSICAALALFFGVGSLLAAPRKAPSSLKSPGSVVTFSHKHERLVSCQLRPDVGSCRERSAPAAAGTTLTLTPISNRLVSEPEEQRAPMTVSLPSRLELSTQELHVERGAWLLTWADQRVALQVAADRKFAVQLETRSGTCTFDAGQCRRRDEIAVTKVVVPPEFVGSR